MAAKSKRCPMCHRVSEGYAHNCRCGYEFGQSVDKAIELLRDQRTNARIGLAVLGTLTLASMALAAYLVVAFGIVVRGMVPVGLLLLATIRTGQKLALTNTSLRQLGARALPKAKLLPK